MTRPFLLILTFAIAVLSSCDIMKSKKWNDLKKSGVVYRKDTLDKFIHSVLEDTETVWINQSYRDFPYKEYCFNNIQAKFNIKDSLIQEILKTDSLEIANRLVAKFQKQGIAIFAGQTIDRFNLNILLYTEENLNPIGTLFDFEIPNEGRLRDDKEWKSYSNLLLKK